MINFTPILDRAIERRGGEAALAERLPVAKTPEELAAVPDDRYLSQMSLRVFRAGLKHSLVDAKWPAFEDAFHGFEPRRVRAMSEETIEGLMKNASLIRHFGKLRSVQANAAALCTIAEEKGGFGRYLADWPGADIVGLWDDLAKRCSQMGGNSGPIFLRMVGKDTFICSESVVKALVAWDAVAAPPKGKRDRAAVQAVFNDWAAATGRPLCQLSMILALSVD